MWSASDESSAQLKKGLSALLLRSKEVPAQTRIAILAIFTTISLGLYVFRRGTNTESEKRISLSHIQVEHSDTKFLRFPPIVEASSTHRISITFHITERP